MADWLLTVCNSLPSSRDRIVCVTGPLTGLRFVEFAGIGPAPLAAMILADLGAVGVRIESPRPGLQLTNPEADITRRGREARVLDLKSETGREAALALLADADLLIEGFRPGVLERLGLGPDDVAARNPRLVYGRVTGWGQDGPLAQRAGHDLNYIAVAGVLAHIGRRGQPPTPPLNLVGDFGAGTMFLVIGVLAALWQAERTGRGAVVDAAIVDGSAVLMTLMASMAQQALWSDERGVNLLDSGAPFYDVYGTKDGKWMAVACLEPAFFATFLELAGLDADWRDRQYDVHHWDALRTAIAGVMQSRSRDEWDAVFRDHDACVSPVLTMAEAAAHPHLQARGVFQREGDLVVPAPAPRFQGPTIAS
jgi:alpha-methylacyl-CoA racemase